MIWLLVVYMWLFIHRPWEVWPWMAAYLPEQNFMIFTLVCWTISGPRFPRWNLLHAYYGLFVFVMFASALLNSQGIDKAQEYCKLVVFYILVVTTVRDKRGLRILVIGYVCVMMLFVAHSMREFYLGRAIYQQGFGRLRGVNSTFGDQNFFAGIVAMSIPFVWVLWREWTGWTKRAVIVCFGLLSWAIILSGSRMGFCGLVTDGALGTLASPNRRVILALSPLILLSAWKIIPNAQKDRYLTISGQAREGSHARVEQNYRTWGFLWGWELFQRKPILGVGPGGTRSIAGEGRATHNSYGELLGDLGAAGVLAFGLVFLGIARNCFEARRIARSTQSIDILFAWHTVAASSAAFLLLAFMGWGLHFLYYFPWLWFGGFQVVALSCVIEESAALPLDEAVEPEPEGGLVGAPLL